MARVTVEGTITPSTFLARGARLTVERTEYIEKLIRRGFIQVVGTQPQAPAQALVEETPTPAPVEETAVPADAEPQPTPPRNARRDTWAAFLDQEKIAYEDSDSRDDLIERWENSQPQADNG